MKINALNANCKSLIGTRLQESREADPINYALNTIKTTSLKHNTRRRTTPERGSDIGPSSIQKPHAVLLLDGPLAPVCSSPMVLHFKWRHRRENNQNTPLHKTTSPPTHVFQTPHLEFEVSGYVKWVECYFKTATKC